MSEIRTRVQEAMKQALKAKEQFRLDCLRMIKGALLLKEKEGKALTDEVAVAALRGEVRKREQTIELLEQHGKAEEIEAARREIAIIEEFLPEQLSEEQVEAKVRAYVAEHPEITQPGPLTGALKRELGDAVDGKLLSDVCRKVLS